ncbi:related to Histone H4.2 [Ramularia collo-cygni]|uniref:Histone H4 n=1 Tax=Ramularia collo-cygni TaxID=112498 RepID=A0A2D3VHR4_9PEZI|nr:related to Histone H4.2 [Ramularia collo-cygni]CZT25680.1 related to Histone H4.2 [Ramularia collo-cygni]
MAKFRSINSSQIIRSDVPHQSSSSSTPAPTPRVGGGLGKGKSNPIPRPSGGKGLGHKTLRRHRKIIRDNILGVTKGDIRRLARRGGVKRISGGIYGDIRTVLRQRLEVLLKDITAVVEVSGRKTVCCSDVVFVLNRLGTPIYGFGDNSR